MRDFSISLGQATLIFLGLLMAAAIAIFLAGPLVPDDKQLASCVVNLRAPIGGLSMNCDSPEFLRLATDPKYLFELKNDRQARPGYIAAAWLVSRPFFFLPPVIEKIGFRAMRATPPRFTRPLFDYFPAYLGYVLLDIFFIWLSARLFWSFFAEDKKISVSVFILSLFFIANGVFFYYFWSPHVQVFNIFAPIFCLWAAWQAYRGAEFWQRNASVLSLLAGLGLLAYTTFCLFLPAVMLGELWREKRIAKAGLLRWSKYLILLALPLASWYLTVILINGSFYNHEAVCCGYGIWHQSANLFVWAAKLFVALGQIFFNLLTKNLYLFLTGLAAAIILWRKDFSRRPMLALAVGVSLIFLIFFSVLTFDPDRVLFAVASVWLAPTALLLEKNNSRRAAAIAAAVYLAGWIAWMGLIGLGAR
ncbi:MAG TPA: hypothetical protein VMC41_03090 [Candidatus Nanoarchaeia archaeon]|nr:hypothetical protein [Candidatus Nanoarchaeia archaeon]